MAKPYLKEWRKHRHYTQDQVIDRLAAFDDPLLPGTAASLSRIENGKQPYSQRIIEALADVYQCSPGELIGRNPAVEGDVIDMLARLSEQQRAQIRDIIAVLTKEAG
jgi:transcriptional regulator with XRE-family HTH domain